MREIPPLDKEPGRKTPAKGVNISLAHPTILLLTVCANDRKPWMTQRPVQESLEKIWKNADTWLVGNYLLMPDHLHLFCAPRDLHFTVEKWIIAVAKNNFRLGEI
jgi:putative transposase